MSEVVEVKTNGTFADLAASSRLRVPLTFTSTKAWAGIPRYIGLMEGACVNHGIDGIRERPLAQARCPVLILISEY
jgi:hypothetical protein